jgi:hypothetical protein
VTRREREIRALFDHEPRLARSCAKPPGQSEARDRRTSMQRAISH